MRISPRGLEHGARARGRESGVQDLFVAHFFEMRPDLWQVGGDAHRHRAFAASGEIVKVQRAELLVNDGAWTGRGGFQIEAVVRHELLHRARRHVVAEQRGRPAAVGQEIDFVADPHRVEVVGVFARERRDARVGQPRDPDGRGFSPAVILDRDVGVASTVTAVPARDVGELGLVLRIRALHAHRERQFRRKTAVGWHREEPLEARVGFARGAEEDAFAVGRPRERNVAVGMRGQPSRLAARRRHDVNILVAVEFPGECHQRAVRRKHRAARRARIAHDQPPRVAAFATNAPQAAAVGEDNLSFTERR